HGRDDLHVRGVRAGCPAPAQAPGEARRARASAGRGGLTSSVGAGALRSSSFGGAGGGGRRGRGGRGHEPGGPGGRVGGGGGGAAGPAAAAVSWHRRSRRAALVPVGEGWL